MELSCVASKVKRDMVPTMRHSPALEKDFSRPFISVWMPSCQQCLTGRLQQLMKVFVAGASGAIGQPLLAALVAARHEVIGMTSKRQYPVIDPATGVFSFIHVEDAAAATVAVLEIRPGVYNIVDNDPAALAIWLPAFADFIGASAPLHISEKAAIQTSGPDAVYYATQLRGASNEKAKTEFGFAPRRLEWLKDIDRRHCA
jgi:nucleoside-diphosphate-sugar epimerase